MLVALNAAFAPDSIIKHLQNFDERHELEVTLLARKRANRLGLFENRLNEFRVHVGYIVRLLIPREDVSRFSLSRIIR